MGFYTELCEVYEIIFPVREKTVGFLIDDVETSLNVLDINVLDIGCGTGGYSKALARKGYKVKAIDLEQAMIEIALREGSPNSPEFFVMDMLDIDLNFHSNSFDLVYCIGNSLPNVASKSFISTALCKMGQMTKKGGTLVVQIVNYDRIISKGITSLPLIENAKAQIRFERRYAVVNAEQIEFNTTLYVKEKCYQNSSLLYPLRSEDVIEGIESAGFCSPKLYGGFDKVSFSVESSAGLIVRATKA